MAAILANSTRSLFMAEIPTYIPYVRFSAFGSFDCERAAGLGGHGLETYENKCIHGGASFSRTPII